MREITTAVGIVVTVVLVSLLFILGLRQDNFILSILLQTPMNVLVIRGLLSLIVNK